MYIINVIYKWVYIGKLICLNRERKHTNRNRRREREKETKRDRYRGGDRLRETSGLSHCMQGVEAIFHC